MITGERIQVSYGVRVDSGTAIEDKNADKFPSSAEDQGDVGDHRFIVTNLSKSSSIGKLNNLHIEGNAVEN